MYLLAFQINSCIKPNTSCCTDLEEACVDVMDYAALFRHHGHVDMICNMLASSNFSNYTEIRYKNLVEKERCDNGTYFCPLALGCVSENNSNCDPSRIAVGDDSFEVFEEKCAENETFCPLVMNCIPKSENCSYAELFEWAKYENATVDPFGRACRENETFCLLTFGCRESCELEDVMGNRSCNGTPGTLMCPETLQCASNETGCNATDGRIIDWTNVTDSTASGRLKN